MTPYYEADGITVYNADCREVLPTLGRFDLLLTDIPYAEVNRPNSGLRNLDKMDADTPTFNLEWFFSSVVDRCDSFYVWCGINQISELRTRFADSRLSTRLCIWEKTNPSPMNGEHLWLSSIESCVYAKKRGAYFGGHCERPVWKGRTTESRIHPTEKPAWLFRKLILASCPPGGSVIDPCAGSLTTAVACKLAGIECTVIEREERYCEAGVKRLAQGVFQF